MNPTELRIGNIISWKESDGLQIGRVASINFNGFVEISDLNAKIIKSQTQLVQCNPIPITSDWLLKFGYSIKEGDCANNVNYNVAELPTDFWAELHGNDWIFFMDNASSEIVKLHAPYVHQYQNLIHALTGQEVKIKGL